MSSCRDLCNAGKHVVITRYEPVNGECVLHLTTPCSAPFPGQLATPIFRVKIMRKDGTKREAVELATEAISDWEQFFSQHGL